MVAPSKLFIALLLPYVLAQSKSLRSILPGQNKHQVSLDITNLTNPNHPELTRKLQSSGYSIAQLGDDIGGEDYYGRSGSALALSGNGRLLAIGAYAAYGYKGHVITYVFNDDTGKWAQHGQKIIGEGGSLG